MAISRDQGRADHQASTGHEQFHETVYGVICAACHDYILIDKTNCPRACGEHEACRQAYA